MHEYRGVRRLNTPSCRPTLYVSPASQLDLGPPLSRSHRWTSENRGLQLPAVKTKIML